MKTLIIVVICLAIVGGGGAWYWHHISTPAFAFRLDEVKRGEMVPTISASGTVEPEDSVDVGAQVAGQIISFGNDKDGKPADFRSNVDENMLLAKIDPVTYEADKDTATASLAQAKASVQSAVANKAQMDAKLEQAKGDWDRAQALLGTEAMSKTDAANYEAIYKTAVANVAVAEAAIATANANVIQNQALLDKAIRNLDYCTITSPIKGTIIDRRVNVGQTVVSSLNTPSLFLIAKDLSEIQVLVSVNEADVGNVYPGQPVTFTVPAHPGRIFKGEVGKVRLNATMTQNVVTYTVEVNTHNADGALYPYMTANVQFEVSREKDVLLVPNAALRWFPQPEMVAPDVREAMANKSKTPSDPAESASAAAAGSAPHPLHTQDGGATTKPTTRPTGNIQHGRGTLWVADGGFVRPIKVRTGATDGVNTEVTVKDDEVKEGLKVVIGEVRAETTDSTTNPLRRRRWVEGEADNKRPRLRMTNDESTVYDSNLREKMDLITLNDIYKTYHVGEIDVPVLKGVSLRVGRGELVALMGASGSGKSTLMNILGCLDRPTSGEYWLDGQECSNLSNDERALVRNHKIGFVFQSFNLLPRTSALQQVMMPLTYTGHNLSRQEGRKRAERMLKLVGLGDRMDHEPSQLSGGQQQRVAIARALVNHPPLLFADEPTGNLDSRTSEEVLKMFQKLNVDEGITIILVTHDSNVANHAKRTIRIRDGLIESGAFGVNMPGAPELVWDSNIPNGTVHVEPAGMR